MLLFSIKKWIGALLSPLPILLLLLTLLLIKIWLAPAGKPYRKWATVSWLWLAVFSTPFLPNYWLGLFEHQYQAYQFHAPKVDGIIVLGCSHNEAPQQPITSQVSPCSMARLNEGIRILRHYPEAQLILSGGRSSFQERTHAQTNAELALALGVKEERIITEPRAQDTADEAMLLAQQFKGKRLILVTSASHMPRAMKLFETQGLTPTPAPTHFIAAYPEQETPAIEWLPHPHNLEKSRRAVYETIGLAWAILTGWYHH